MTPYEIENKGHSRVEAGLARVEELLRIISALPGRYYVSSPSGENLYSLCRNYYNDMKELSCANIPLPGWIEELAELCIELLDRIKTLANHRSERSNWNQGLEYRFKDLSNRYNELSDRFKRPANECKRLSGRYKRLSGRFSTLSQRFSTLSGEFSTLSGRFSTLSRKFSTLSEAFPAITERFLRLSGRWLTR